MNLNAGCYLSFPSHSISSQLLLSLGFYKPVTQKQDSWIMAVSTSTELNHQINECEDFLWMNMAALITLNQVIKSGSAKFTFLSTGNTDNADLPISLRHMMEGLDIQTEFQTRLEC